MFEFLMVASLILLVLTLFACLYRVWKGPSIPDRVQALDTIGITLVAGVAIISVILKSYAFLEVILLIGILSFIGTVAYARFLERGVAIERKRVE